MRACSGPERLWNRSEWAYLLRPGTTLESIEVGVHGPTGRPGPYPAYPAEGNPRGVIDPRAPPRARSSPATLRLSLGQASRFSPRRRCRPAAVPPHRRPSRPLACPPSRTAAHTVAIFADGGVVCVQRFMQHPYVLHVCARARAHAYVRGWVLHASQWVGARVRACVRARVCACARAVCACVRVGRAGGEGGA